MLHHFTIGFIAWTTVFGFVFGAFIPEARNDTSKAIYIPKPKGIYVPPPRQHTSAPTATNPDQVQPTSSSSGGSSGSLSSIESRILAAHNQYRALHQAPAMTWSSTLASYAQSYASQCVFAHSGGPYGENLAEGYDTPESATAAWYNEGQNYDYNSQQIQESALHFTQLVWKSSTQLGCAWVSCNNFGYPAYMYICEYNPQGNVVDSGSDPAYYFMQNVLP